MSKICISLILLTLLVLPAAAPADEVTTGSLVGRWVSSKNVPIPDGLVLLFNAALGPPPLPEKYWRVPNEMVVSDSEGRFSIELEAGNYYLGTMKRKKVAEIGPLMEGDSYFFSRNAQGMPILYTVKKGEKTDIGSVKGAMVYKKALLKTPKNITAIEGAIRGEDGKPVSGALVMAYRSPEMVGKPLFISDRTKKDGTYKLLLSEGGSYYLKVRDIYGGGKPEAGTILSYYGGDKPQVVNVETGKVTKKIDIMSTVFSGSGKQE